MKNVPHPSSVFERTINPHSSNAYIVLCTHYSACSCLFGLIPVKDGTRMSTLVTFFMSLSDPGVFGPNFYFLFGFPVPGSSEDHSIKSLVYSSVVLSY